MLRSCARPLRGMPKKTKKEKQLAQVRRMHLSSVVANHTAPIATDLISPTQTSFTLAKTSAPSKTDTVPYLRIKRDLFRTVALAMVILISELLLAQRLQ